ncbi:MAG: hypothetical protein NVSMB18_03560 [Acetobacteraceae bacterium]
MAGVVALAGCVVPAPLVVLPGQQKSQSEFQRDDTACRGGAAVATTPDLTSASHAGYLQCMAGRGNAVVAVPRAYPYPAYTYGYTGYYPWLYGPAYWDGAFFGLGVAGFYDGFWGPGWGYGPGWGGPGWHGGPGFRGGPGFGGGPEGFRGGPGGFRGGPGGFGGGPGGPASFGGGPGRFGGGPGGSGGGPGGSGGGRR